MFTFEQFSRAARSNLLQTPSDDWQRSDDDMNEMARAIPEGVERKAAAVLVPIVVRHQPTMLLTQRHSGLAQHAGQIAFPGGRMDAGETAEQAALREAREEIGLDGEFVEVLGYLPGYLTVTNYLVRPVVALVRPGFALHLQADEVDEAFEVPLAFLMEMGNCQRQSRQWGSLTRHFYVYQFGDRHIWGATAGMIRNLHDQIYPQAAKIYPQVAKPGA